MWAMTGTATETGEERRLVPQRQARAGGARVQQRQARKDSWTLEEERIFLLTLAECCNVSEAAREIGKCRQGAYARRKRRIAFARAWDAALEEGYCELEMMLMRASLFGSESEEIVMDGDGVVKSRKVKRAPNLTIGLRLLQHHRARVTQIRAAKGRKRSGPDSADAKARVRAMLEEIRRRRAAAGE